MPRLGIRDFSGGLVTNQSEFDLQDNQYQSFDNVVNKKPGRIERPKDQTIKSGTTAATSATPELAIYRTEKDESDDDNSTEWWILGNKTSVKRHNVADDSGGSWETITSGFSEGTPVFDFLVHNQVLRIADGTFDNDSKWYGHIKRDVLGQSVAYDDASKQEQPADASNVNEWVLDTAKPTPPTVILMGGSYDSTNLVNSANKVGLYMYYPSSESYYLLEDVSTANTFTDNDKYTVTFIYDYIQETELGRNGSNTIGVVPSLASLNSGKRVPAVNIVVNTTSLNKRITGINLYWQPKGEVDWYLITTLDIDRGWADSPLAMETSRKVEALLSGTSNNMGYWQPCPDIPNARNSGDLIDLKSTTTSQTYIEDSVSNWVSAFSCAVGDITLASKSSTVSDAYNRIDSLIGIVDAFTSGSTEMNLTYNPINHTDLYSNDPYSDGYTKVLVAPIAANKVSAWYMPNDGLKLSTYNSLTGRDSKTKLSAIKWNTSAIMNNRGYYGDIDTVDSNEQTVREKNRIYFTDPFKLDEILPGRYLDIGRNDGDTIIALKEYRGKLFIFKKRHTYIVNSRHIIEKHFVGVGADHKHSIYESPIGLVCANQQGIYVVDTSTTKEISFKIRDTWQGISISNPKIGYDGIDNELSVVPISTDTTMYVMNLDNGCWIKRDIDPGDNMSNFVFGSNFRSHFFKVN